VVAVAVWVLSACLESPAVTCADGRICAASKVCAPAGGCVDPGQLVACDGRGDADPCTLAGIGAGLCRDGVCVVARCGDGVLDIGEACDDGNEIDDDDCTNNCTVPTCGDGVVQTGEQCDEGAANADDRACTTRCMSAVCGDGFTYAGTEECDVAGANADDDACTSACLQNVCGDGKLWAGVEACDDGNDDSGDGCRADCRKVESCGDAMVDEGEACDDGNLNAADGCDACVATEWLAGAVVGGNIGATELGLTSPRGTAVDAFGNLFIADTGGFRVRRVDRATGVITDVAGTGAQGYAGDGGPATSARLNQPNGVAADGHGNVFIADTGNQRIRRVDGMTGVITTVAGGGAPADGLGDGGPATSARLVNPGGVTVDGLGNLYIADTWHNRVRRVDAVTGAITSVAGTGTFGFSGDGGAATLAELDQPGAVAVDGDGNLYVADTYNHRIRSIDAVTGIITTSAGGGTPPDGVGDGGLAVAAKLVWPGAVILDGAGDLLVADTYNHRVRRVAKATSTITTVAGGGAGGVGDGGPAAGAALSAPRGLAVDGDGNLFIGDTNHHRVRRVAVATGLITTVAGSGLLGFTGDGAAATSVRLANPTAVATDGLGNLFFADSGRQRVRRIDAATGVISTVAGNGTQGYSGDTAARSMPRCSSRVASRSTAWAICTLPIPATTASGASTRRLVSSARSPAPEASAPPATAAPRRARSSRRPEASPSIRPATF
jgi:cysteine-rich repeat protein